MPEITEPASMIAEPDFGVKSLVLVSVKTEVIEALSLYPFQLLLYVPKSISTSFPLWLAIFIATLFLTMVLE